MFMLLTRGRDYICVAVGESSRVVKQKGREKGRWLSSLLLRGGKNKYDSERFG